ncbi:MAG: sialidase family protein [Mycobacteriales bacterium]
MRRTRIAGGLGSAAVSAVALSLAVGGPASAAGVPPPAVIHVGQIDRQDIAPQPNSEPDTVTEPDVAVSPVNRSIAVSVAQDGRYLTGGAVTNNYSWTHDGGRTWHHRPLPHLSKPQGGAFDGASDPVVAFGPDGTVYAASLLTSATCPNAVAVSKSTDGGRTFGGPVIVDSDPTCDNSHTDDKEEIAVDTSRTSPHHGRVYVFYTSISDGTGSAPAGSPQIVRWSDDHGRHWSAPVRVTAPTYFTQGAQPMLQADGTITISYFDYGTSSAEKDATGLAPHGAGVTPHAAGVAPHAATAPVIYKIRARTSYDGGATWTGAAHISSYIGYGPGDVRCCIPPGTADPVTGRMYAAWNGVDPSKVFLSYSDDGRHWSPAKQVNTNYKANLTHVNVDVAAYGGKVFVFYGTRDQDRQSGRYVQYQVSTSYDKGATFGPAVSLGPAANLKYAAIGSGKPFPGDYMGSAATSGRLYLAWCVSSRPKDPTATYHQVAYGAVLRF